MLFYKLYDIMPWSLSARRAWIEMRMALFPAPPTMVALRKESVDRNTTLTVFYAFSKSLSARRAWIEIVFLTLTVPNVPSRSPQGERG